MKLATLFFMKKQIILAVLISLLAFEKSNAQNLKHFNEALNTPVYTTKFVLNEKKTITYVTHDFEDGAWQFFSSDNFDSYEEVAKIVSLEQIIKIDATLVELADLPLGYIATRKDSHDQWKIKKKSLVKQ